MKIRQFFKIYFLWAVFALFFLHSGWASAQQSVDQLRTDVANAMNSLTEIQQEFRSIRGQVEASAVLKKESERVYQDLDLRVATLEDKIDQIHNLLKSMQPAAPGSAGTSAPSGIGETSPATTATLGDYEDFQNLLNLVNAQDYRSALSGFMGFIQKYPRSNYASQAQFWVGDCYFFMGDFAKSIAEFQKMIEKYPGNPRISEALYKQGLAFLRLKKYNEARLFFQKVMASYPGTAEAAKAQARLLRVAEYEMTQPAAKAGPTTAAAPSSTVTNTPIPEERANPNSSGSPLF